jgi:hypothetical protein
MGGEMPVQRHHSELFGFHRIVVLANTLNDLHSSL